jgi:hypothetical protein
MTNEAGIGGFDLAALLIFFGGRTRHDTDTV